MYFGYIEGINTVGLSNNSYLQRDKVPRIIKKGTSFRQILGGNRPDTVKDTKGNIFATRKLFDNIYITKYKNKTISIKNFTLPSNTKILPMPIIKSAEIESQSPYYYYEINRSFCDFKTNLYCYTEVNTLFSDISTSYGAHDFMLFATDEIIDGKRTIMYLSDNKFTIINKESGQCYGSSTFGVTGVLWYNLNFTQISMNFDIASGVFNGNLPSLILFYLGTTKQAGNRYIKMVHTGDVAQYAEFDYGNLIEFNDATKTFYRFHFFNPDYHNFTEISLGRHTNVYNQTLYEDTDNPIPPDIDVPPEIPLPDPEDPTDPTNPDNPDNLEPEPSDPIPKPIPSPSPAFTAKLITAYRLSADNLSALANEMWTQNFYDNIVKMFTNPMDCLISLSEYPIDIPAGVTQAIQLGNVKMETAGAVIRNPFITVDLGLVELDEKFKSYLDYVSTTVTIYLPFIGFEQVSIDYMNSQLQLQYNVDIMSGNCVAILYAISYNSNLQSVVGQWNGNMAYSIPLSGRDFSQMASSLWNTAMSAGSVIASSRIPTMGATGFSKGITGGFGLPSLDSVSDLGNSIINTIEAANATTSGGHLSANAGHLGSLQPYLIITRPVQKINANYYNSYGRTLDAYTPFNVLIGYTKIKSVNLTLPSATAEEIKMVENLLKNEGVIF